jgi:hypothetical protein
MSTHTLSRRSIVAGAAALPVAAVPAIASAIEPDPIFAAIEAHEVTFTHYVRMSEIVSSMLLDTPGTNRLSRQTKRPPPTILMLRWSLPPLSRRRRRGFWL